MVKLTASPGNPRSFTGSDCLSDDTHCSPRSVGLRYHKQLYTEGNRKVNANRISVKSILVTAKGIYVFGRFHITSQITTRANAQGFFGFFGVRRLDAAFRVWATFSPRKPKVRCFNLFPTGAVLAHRIAEQSTEQSPATAATLALPDHQPVTPAPAATPEKPAFPSPHAS